MKKGFVIAIDGPVASGKGTVAKMLAQKLQGFDLWTGAFYRCLALYCIENKINFQDKELVIKALPHFFISIENRKIFLNKQDVTEKIISDQVSNGSSIVSLISEVRKFMVKKQQAVVEQMLENGAIIVAEGRDTATRVFPNAALKVFLTSTLEVRAKRRFEQLQKQGNIVMEDMEEQVFQDTQLRDQRDIERATDPLVANPLKYGYFVLDNSKMTEEETVGKIISELKERKIYL